MFPKSQQLKLRNKIEDQDTVKHRKIVNKLQYDVIRVTAPK